MRGRKCTWEFSLTYSTFLYFCSSSVSLYKLSISKNLHFKKLVQRRAEQRIARSSWSKTRHHTSCTLLYISLFVAALLDQVCRARAATVGK